MGFPVAVKRCDRSPHLVTEYAASALAYAVQLLVLDLHQWFTKTRLATVQFYNYSTYFTLCRNQQPAHHLLVWLYVTELIAFLIMFQLIPHWMLQQPTRCKTKSNYLHVPFYCNFANAVTSAPSFFHTHLNRWTMVPHTMPTHNHNYFCPPRDNWRTAQQKWENVLIFGLDPLLLALN